MQSKTIIRVLIVDESPLLRRDVRRAVSRTGIAGIHDFGAGAEALSVLPAVQPAIVIIGHTLEDMPGVQLSRKIRSCPEFAQMPLILLSPVGHLEDLMEAVDNGIDAYVVVPFEPTGLADKVRDAVARIQHLPELPPRARADAPAPESEPATRRPRYAHRSHVDKET